MYCESCLTRPKSAIRRERQRPRRRARSPSALDSTSGTAAVRVIDFSRAFGIPLQRFTRLVVRLRAVLQPDHIEDVPRSVPLETQIGCERRQESPLQGFHPTVSEHEISCHGIRGLP